MAPFPFRVVLIADAGVTVFPVQTNENTERVGASPSREGEVTVDGFGGGS